MWDLLRLPLVGLLAVSTTMLLLWLVQRRTRNAGIVDVAWSGSIGLLAVLYAILEDGWGPRRTLIAVLAGGWSLRLTIHLARRVFSESEDGRYLAIRKEKGADIDRWLFWFFQAQALIAVLLSLTFLVPLRAEEAGWRIWDVIASAVWLVSIIGESVADRQLAGWRVDPANRGRTCRGGLWRFSRHPNYFFEWMHWLVYPLLAVGLPYGWVLWLAPAVMLYLVLFVTGVPPTEERAIQSRGDDYRAYQRTTNAFFPGPSRVTPTEPSIESR